MSNSDAALPFAVRQETIEALQLELEATQRGLLALTLEMEQRVDERTEKIRAAHAELAETNAELTQLALELEDRVAARTAELQAKNDEIRAMSQQLWQAAKLATVGELAASIAHELNNPLATVSLRVESLLAQVATDDTKRRPLEVIEGEVERMGTLVARLLEFSRRRSQQQISTLDVCGEIESTLELVHYHLRNREISIAREFASRVPDVHADRQQLRQLFLNLFTNASDAMPEGGTLTIRVAVHRASDRRVGRGARDDGERQGQRADRGAASADGAAQSVVIEVADTGVGIASEDLPRVMEAFFTTKPEGKGSGLGLPICRRIAQEHHGTFDIFSEVGKGTTVRVTLPTGNSQAILMLG